MQACALRDLISYFYFQECSFELQQKVKQNKTKQKVLNIEDMDWKEMELELGIKEKKQGL